MPADRESHIAALRATLAELEAQIAESTRLAADIRAAIEALEGRASTADDIRLHPRNQSDIDTSMHPTVRVRHSEGAVSDKRTRRFLKAAHDHRHTMRSACEAVGIKQPTVSQALRGLKSIAHSRAAKFEKLIGYEATQANWPRLRLDE
jgi:hypothetical protein